MSGNKNVRMLRSGLCVCTLILEGGCGLYCREVQVLYVFVCVDQDEVIR